VSNSRKDVRLGDVKRALWVIRSTGSRGATFRDLRRGGPFQRGNRWMGALLDGLTSAGLVEKVTTTRTDRWVGSPPPPNHDDAVLTAHGLAWDTIYADRLDDWLSEDETARRLDVSVVELAHWRDERDGPRFDQVGHDYRYRVDRVDAWLNGKRRTLRESDSA
jgi:hypothetical protein